MDNEEVIDENGWILYQMPQPCEAKYLVVAVEGGKTVEVNYFDSFEDAKRTFEEIASDHGLEPCEINRTGYYDVSIWEWTEDRYKNVFE